MPPESPAQKAVVVGSPIGECDPLAVDGLDQRQAMLPRESRIVVGGEAFGFESASTCRIQPSPSMGLTGMMR